MPPDPAALRLFPLGGLGEVGMNCLALWQGRDILVIDCGTQFPQGDHGVDVIHPDFSWLLEHREQVRGLVLTHGHEDHIGALPYLLRELNIPVWGPAHALSLARLRLEDHRDLSGAPVFHTVEPGQRVSIGSFTLEPVRVTHSIVEATALAIDTVAGVMLHSGDFKFDPAPADGQQTDERRLRALGDQGVALLASDSTNILSSGTSGSEKEVHDALFEVVNAAKHRVVVALFASNVQRLISLGRIARRTGRRIALLGRSLLRHVEVARLLGHLDWSEELLLPADRLASYPRDEVMILAGGTQGEPGSALVRMAERSHRFVGLGPGDTVVFSSRTIPGNERPVSRLIDHLLRLGVNVITSREHNVHSSGHACRAEQQRLIELVRPSCFLPVHGTRQHLEAHAQLARDCGVERVQVVEDGQSVVLSRGVLTLGEHFASGEVQVALGGVTLSAALVAERKDLGRHGLISIAPHRASPEGANLEGGDARLETLPVVVARGVAWTKSATLERLQRELELCYRALGGAPAQTVCVALSRTAKSWCLTRLGACPSIVVHPNWP